MIRASLDAASPNAFAYVTENEGDHFLTENVSGAQVVTPRYWGGEFRIVRRGNTFTVFNRDPTGGALSRMTEQRIDLPSTVYLGFGVVVHTGLDPSATAAEAKSTITGFSSPAGIAKLMGFVPSIDVIPPHGATLGSLVA